MLLNASLSCRTENDEIRKENVTDDEQEGEERNDYEKAEIIFNVLLNNPYDFELQSKPSAARGHNFMCTLDMNNVSVASARADDNGAYGRRGNSTKFFYWFDGLCLMAHKSEKGYFIKQRDNSAATKRPVYKTEYVDENRVYQLTRQYRHSKSNNFYTMIAIIRHVKESFPHPYYMYLSRWKGGVTEDFAVERHGNASKAHAAAYYRKDPKVFSNARETLATNNNMPDEVYTQLSKDNPESNSVSEMVTNPKMIHNLKQSMKNRTPDDDNSEAEALINLVRGNSFVQTVSFNQYCYSSLNYLPQTLNDIKRFCVDGNSTLIVDMTFKVADRLWLTDTCFENESLIDSEGNHPNFPGPSQWQFRKDQLSFRRFFGELLIAEPSLHGIKKVGHDLDNATAAGVRDILPQAKHLWCTQHMQSADKEKLRSMNANRHTTDRIMSDIYGYQAGTVMQDGLADAIDATDLQIKLDSLRSIWEELIPGFHDWFKKNRVAKFESCLVQSSRESLGISGRFYSNNLELTHRLLKKKLNDLVTPSDVTSTSEALTKWMTENFYDEARKALIGQGKYRLADGYQKFFVEPTEWVRMSGARKTQHFETFLAYSPNSFRRYVKPSDAGAKKKPGEKRRARLPEADMFKTMDAHLVSPPITPLKITKKNSTWEVKNAKNNKTTTQATIDVFNPHRTTCKLYQLVHKSDKSLFPASVKRCEECKISFTSADIIAIKTTAVREFTDAQGRRRKNNGNVYLHFLNNCLKGHDQKFDYSAVIVPEKTKIVLSDIQISKLVEVGCVFETL